MRCPHCVAQIAAGVKKEAGEGTVLCTCGHLVCTTCDRNVRLHERPRAS